MYISCKQKKGFLESDIMRKGEKSTRKGGGDRAHEKEEDVLRR